MSRAQRILISILAVMGIALLLLSAMYLTTCSAANVAGSAAPSATRGDAGATARDIGGNAVGPIDGHSIAPAPAAQVRRGLGAFVDPGDMEVDTWTTLEFVVGPDETAIAEETEDQRLTAPRVVYLAELMRVTLLPDPNFDIQPQSSAVQDAGADLRATWQWKVKPRRGGTATLYAKVEVGQKQADGGLVVAKTYTRRVAIRVKVGTWTGFLNALRSASNLGDALNVLFASWEKTLLALAALVIAASGVWVAIKNWGKPRSS